MTGGFSSGFPASLCDSFFFSQTINHNNWHVIKWWMKNTDLEQLFVRGEPASCAYELQLVARLHFSLPKSWETFCLRLGARVHLGFVMTASDVPATCSFYSLDAKVKQCGVPSVSFVPPSRKPAHDVVCPRSHFTVKFLKFPSIDSVSLLICGHSVFCCLIKC